MNTSRTFTTSTKRAATLLGSALATGALVLSSTSPAQAATFQNGDSNSDRSVRDGSGQANSSVRATDAGSLRVSTEADGGSERGGIFPTPDAPTVATAFASVSNRASAASGTYRVVVRWQGLQGTERDRGSDADALVQRRSTVQFVSQGRSGGDRTVRRFQEVPTQRTNTSTQILVDIPRGANGFLRVTGALHGNATAVGNNSSAEARASVADVDISINRIN